MNIDKQQAKIDVLFESVQTYQRLVWAMSRQEEVNECYEKMAEIQKKWDQLLEPEELGEDSVAANGLTTPWDLPGVHGAPDREDADIAF